MTIPEIRERLLEIAGETGIDELVTLAHQLRRRSVERKADVQSEPMTPLLKMAIANYARLNPGASYAEIARRYQVNIGRVSEALRGKRT